MINFQKKFVKSSIKPIFLGYFDIIIKEWATS